MLNLISIQISSQDSIDHNLQQIKEQVDSACRKLAIEDKNEKIPTLVVLPECASIFGVGSKRMRSSAESFGKGLIQNTYSELAAKHECYLVAGTTPILFPSNKEAIRYSACSLVFAPDGKCLTHYNKIHLFDVEVDDNTKSYKESNSTIPGNYLSLFKIDNLDIAQTVCYDLRFPDMFSAYSSYTHSKQAPHIFVIPSAFTKVTGDAHWHSLLRARSIETQSFVVASNQVGKHADKRETFGNTCIYSPWGECLDCIENDIGFASAKFDIERLTSIRAKMPISSHKKARYELES